MNALVDMVTHTPIAMALQQSLGRVADLMATHLRSDLPDVEALCRHVERYRGKMLRPTMVLVTGLATREPDRAGPSSHDLEHTLTTAHFTIAAVLETIHIATLVHDDVLDEADERRRASTVNRMKGNEIAVILGDYLLARSFHLCSTLDNQRIALRVGEVTGVVCEGEMLQLSRRGDPSLDERTYFDIIERKTAALIGVACELGAHASGADDTTSRRLYEFGVKLGIAFQIIDDLLDLLGDQRVVGKSLHKDLEKGKMTLPLIHHLRTAPIDAASRQLIESMVRGESSPDSDAVARALQSTGSVTYARQTAADLVAEARALLSTLPDTPARALMHALAESVVAREY